MHQLLAEITITVGRGDLHTQLVVGGFTFELALEPRDEMAMPMKIPERLLGGGAVDDGATIILQGVIERNDRVFFDGHDGDSGNDSGPAGLLG